ncbi:Uncharacterised protein [Mycolicibacterium aurum]|uniref:Uncharacterized protein n=1 Tax=Mycolicibacterium aurum TaxID=1791 RepID=A0A448IIV9_MYCAU|nr:hypothetical protein [Mycolicibacterium aurum]VEG52227.1 Uncharacterised protein [Mycolicibacterium aurum]
MRLLYLLLAPAAVCAGLTVAPTAAADCTSAGATTLCSQGTSRGSNTGTGPVGSSGPYVPYPCDINWYDCDDYWSVNLGIDVDPGPGGPDFGRPGAPDLGNPGRPGGGGGFGGGGGRGGGRGR